MTDTVKTNRRKYIGGSDVPTLLGINKFKIYDDLLDYYLSNEVDNFLGSEYTEYGNLMEEKIRAYANKVLGVNTKPKCRIFEDKMIRCNTDGYDEYNKVIFEIKTNNGKHSNTFDYEVQMQLYMWAFNVNEGYLIQYKRPKDFYKGYLYEVQNTEEFFNLDFDEKNISIKHIKRSDELINIILDKIQKFWEQIKITKEKTYDKFRNLQDR